MNLGPQIPEISMSIQRAILTLDHDGGERSFKIEMFENEASSHYKLGQSIFLEVCGILVVTEKSVDKDTDRLLQSINFSCI